MSLLDTVVVNGTKNLIYLLESISVSLNLHSNRYLQLQSGKIALSQSSHIQKVKLIQTLETFSSVHTTSKNPQKRARKYNLS